MAAPTKPIKVDPELRATKESGVNETTNEQAKENRMAAYMEAPASRAPMKAEGFTPEWGYTEGRDGRDWDGQEFDSVGGEWIKVRPLFSAAMMMSPDDLPRCELRTDPVTGFVIPTIGFPRRILTRAEFERIVAKAREFYDKVGTDGRIADANADRPPWEILFEADSDSDCNRPKGKPGSVYVVRGADGCCKIGKSENLAARLLKMATDSPVQIELLMEFQVRDMNWFEQALHKRYASRRVRREWFRLADGDLAELRELHIRMPAD